jgi:hypothetical protein
MKAMKRFTFIEVMCVMSLLAYGAIGFSQAPQPIVQLITEPPLERIRPFEAEASTNQLPVHFTGLAGGWVIGQRRHTHLGEIAPQPVRLLLSGAIVVAIAVLFYVNVSSN